MQFTNTFLKNYVSAGASGQREVKILFLLNTKNVDHLDEVFALPEKMNMCVPFDPDHIAKYSCASFSVTILLSYVLRIEGAGEEAALEAATSHYNFPGVI